MAADKPQSHTRPVQTGPGKTGVPESAPRLPHERDESADSQRSEPRPKMRQAHDDVAAGRMDTDRGPPSNEAYQKQKSPGTPRV
jgi:hypothetical protein